MEVSNKNLFFEMMGIDKKNMSFDELVSGYEKLLWYSYNSSDTKGFVNIFLFAVSTFNGIYHDFFPEEKVDSTELSSYIYEYYDQLHEIEKIDYEPHEFIFLISCAIHQRLQEESIVIPYENNVVMAFQNSYCITKKYEESKQDHSKKKYS